MDARIALGCVWLLAACGSVEDDAASGGTGGAGGAAGSVVDASAGTAGSSAAGGSAGTSSGGSAGTGGSAGVPGAPPECASAQDCVVHADCCTCQSLAPGEPTPAVCDKTCLVDVCTSMGSPALECIAGRCVLDKTCDVSKVTCTSPAPVCADGELPVVSGSCWGSGCIKASECSEVTDCDSCDPSLYSCVRYQTELGPSHHCVTVPSQCAADPTCACMGSSVCIEPYSSCTDLSSVQALGCS
jgi:hypothetical protein